MTRDHWRPAAIVPAAANTLCAFALSCLFIASTSAADEEAHVLILNGLGSDLPVYQAVDGAMRASLDKETSRRVVFYSESLDSQRFSMQALEPEFLQLFSKKYNALRIDVVVILSQNALDFFKRYGSQLWPGARPVYIGAPGEQGALPNNATAVKSYWYVEETIDLARRLQPNARRIVVISGAADEDILGEQAARRLLSTKVGSAEVEYLSGVPQPELIARLATEPPDTIVLYLAQFRDRNGRPYTPREVLRAINEKSSAPIYSGGSVETYMGYGMVAGVTEMSEDLGRRLGEQVRAALASDPSDSGGASIAVPHRCIADAQLLKRWSLDERRLPSGCDIRFVDRTFWREYLWQILVTLAIIVIQAALIAALLVQRHRRRVAEAESLTRFAEMAHMNRRVSIGEISASIAHELNQPLGAIYNNAGAAEVLIKADPPRLESITDILADIKRDDQRASDIIARIRKLLRKTEFEVSNTDLNEAIEDAVKMLSAEASSKEVSVKTELESGLAKVKADRVQLQQVILNLALNAIDAMRGQPATSNALMIRSRSLSKKEAEVSVADSGRGIPSESLASVFEPFVTTKPGGLGLGLAISRTIIKAHGGEIRAENSASGGAVFRFTLPFATVSQS
jgi:signal transduction histidine kinase